MEAGIHQSIMLSSKFASEAFVVGNGDDKVNMTVYRDNLTTIHNSTEYDDPLNFGVLLLIPIILLIAGGNILVIVAVSVDKKLLSPTNCFLSSLAVADLLVALTVMPPSLIMIVNNYKWPLPDGVCSIWLMLDVFFSTTSIFHLCMISFDRYMALARPFKHNNSGIANSKLGGFQYAAASATHRPAIIKRIVTRIIIVWTVPLGIAIAIPIKGSTDRGILFVGEMCAINFPSFQIGASMVAFFAPLVAMFIMYTLTIRTLQKQARLVSSMMVFGSGKGSPSAFKKSLQKQKSSQQHEIDDCKNCVYTASQLPRRQLSSTATDDISSGSVSESLRSMLIGRQMSNTSCKCDKSGEEREEKSLARAAVMPVAKAFRQVQTMVRIRGVTATSGRRRHMSSAEVSYDKRCSCNKMENSQEDEAKGKLNLFPRKYRSSVRRISSSFKNRAMASITNEQRASKILGLIFVLFCVFWCPFFLTNVISQLCSTCNQELMGNCMNWFVWIGYVSSGVNPCVYTLFSSQFRRTFKLLLKCNYSEINNRKLRTRSSSIKDTSCASSGPAIYRRSSRGSIRPSLPPVKENRSQGRVSPRLDEEETWLNHVRSARSMTLGPGEKQEKVRQESWMTSTKKLWRSSWQVVNQEDQNTSAEDESQSVDKNADNIRVQKTKSENGVQEKREEEEEELLIKTTINEIGENDVESVSNGETCLRKEDSPSSSDSSPLYNAEWAKLKYIDQHEPSSQKIEAKDSSPIEATTESDGLLGNSEEADNTEFNRCEQLIDETQKNEPEPNSLLKKQTKTSQLIQNRKHSLTNSEVAVYKREKLSREDSGMGASFDNLFPRNENHNNQ